MSIIFGPTGIFPAPLILPAHPTGAEMRWLDAETEVKRLGAQLAAVTLERDLALANLNKLQADIRRAWGISRGEISPTRRKRKSKRSEGVE